MQSGLRWIRRRQRALARAVLPLFCAAWLQAAIVPCVAAHDAPGASPPPRPGAPQHASGHAGHGAVPSEAADGHAAHGHAPDGAAVHGGTPHCPYCPPAATPGEHGSCDGHGGCAYPHEPQVDARAAAIFAALAPCCAPPLRASQPLARRVDLPPPGLVPRVPIPVSYCRFTE